MTASAIAIGTALAILTAILMASWGTPPERVTVRQRRPSR